MAEAGGTRSSGGWRVLAPRFERFREAWVAFSVAVSVAVFVMTSLAAILHPDDDWSPVAFGGLYLLLLCGAALIGLVLTPFRHLFVGPRAPFVRPGMGLLAVAPWLFGFSPHLTWAERARNVVSFEIFLILGLLTFVVLGHRLGAFPEARDGPDSTEKLTPKAGFFLAWALLIVSLVGGTLVVGLSLSLVVTVFTPRGAGQGEVTIGALSMYAAVVAMAGGALLGAPFAAFRRHIVRPDFPFLRWGYLAAATAPVVGAGLAVVALGEAFLFWFALYAQAPLLVATLIYVAVARLCGLFEGDGSAEAVPSA